jgi:hypothetical protein
MPDTSGDVFQTLASIDAPTNGLYNAPLWKFSDSGNKDSLGGSFIVPAGVSTPVFRAVWLATVTTGTVVWDVDYSCDADAESADPASHDESITVTTDTDGTAWAVNTSDMSATLSNFSEGDLCQFLFSRDGAQAADDLASPAYLMKILFLYS